jgi:flavin reductase (DIM6/NTAB) family NADH-FMN oxidoreductase RutF
MCVEWPTGELSPEKRYALIISVMVPRPIAWVSSVDAEGRPNVAPFSFFTCVATHPLLVGFTVMSRAGRAKDTLANAERTGEWVINVVTEDLLPQAVRTSIEAPPDFDEARYAGLELEPAVEVRAPRIKGSPVHMECRRHQIIPFGIADGRSNPSYFVVGEVVRLHVADAVLADGRVDPLALAAAGRMGGPLYTRTRELLRYDRPQWPKDAAESWSPPSPSAVPPHGRPAEG